jgi:hypothetical protein
MTGLKMLVAAALISTISPVSAGSEGGPEGYLAQYPNRDASTGSSRLRAGLAWNYRMALRQTAT